MKTLIPLTVASIALAASINLFAGETLLSPRANDAQIKTAATVTESSAVFNKAVASPRVLDNEMKLVKADATSPSTIASGCAIGSPRQLEQAGKYTSGNCCKVTSVRCTTPKSCCN